MEDRHPDLDYVIGEVTNINTELELHFGTAGITNARLTRLESALRELLSELPSGPHYAVEFARAELDRPLSEFKG